MSPKRRSTNGRGSSRRGSAIVEFSLVAIPLLFLICFTIEFGRAIWSYHTLAGSVKSSARYVIVHGARCSAASVSCRKSVGDIAARLRSTGFGLDPAMLSVTLNAGDNTRVCNPISSCFGDGSPWPPAGANAVGLPISIDAVYDFEAAMFSFWPGQSRAAFSLIASSQETIQF